MSAFTRIWREIGRSEDPQQELRGAVPPVIWLLGKTGAGKSSLIRTLTGLEQAEIGSGFAPCTRASQSLAFPPEHPLMRFLDTRGLGEVGYDPAEDLREAEGAAHMVVIVARLEDPVQGEVVSVVRTLRKRRPGLQMFLVITGADLAQDAAERDRAAADLRAAYDAAAGRPLPHVVVSLVEPEDPFTALAPLVKCIATVMPQLALALGQPRPARDRGRWAEHRAEVLWYAGAASTADALPLVGAVAVPGIQAAMLRALAARYGVDWNRARFQEFAAGLGAAIALRYGASYGIRQAAKLIPVVGQTAGAAMASTLSFATTFGLGRAACFYLDALSRGEDAAPEELRRIYLDAFRRGETASSGAARRPD